MNKESLIKAREVLLKTLSKTNIDQMDKLELMLNLNRLLDEKHYEEDIKVLRHNKK